jgi:hypothetical protein
MDQLWTASMTNVRWSASIFVFVWAHAAIAADTAPQTATKKNAKKSVSKTTAKTKAPRQAPAPANEDANEAEVVTEPAHDDAMPVMVTPKSMVRGAAAPAPTVAPPAAPAPVAASPPSPVATPPPAPVSPQPETPAPAPVPAPPPSKLDFDLLGDATPTAPPVSDSKIKARRIMLQLHQGLGIAMFAVTVGAAITGQLNYSDRFQGGSTGRYETIHGVFAYTSFSMFVVTGALAIFAPSPLEKNALGLDRITLHRIGMYGAAVGMIAQVILGIVTTKNEGFTAQQGLAEAHLAVGYATAGLMAFGVGALVF